MSDDLIETISPYIKKALKMGADEVEIFAQRKQTRIANIESNDLKSADAGLLEGVGIRILVNKSLGFASVNSFKPKFIESGIQRAISIARVTQPQQNQYLPSLKESSSISGIYDPEVSSLTMETVIDYGVQLLSAVSSLDSRVTIQTGSVLAQTSENSLLNSQGIEKEETKSLFGFGVFGWATDGADVGSWIGDGLAVVNVCDYKIDPKVKSFVENCLVSLCAKKTESFEGTAIFSPGTMTWLLSVLVQSASAVQIQSGSSKLADRLGDEIAVKELSVINDSTLRNRTGSASFDREGTSTMKCPLIEDGIFKSILYDIFSANKDEMESTGHASGTYRTTPTTSCSNLDIKAGTQFLEEMISEVDRGVIFEGIDTFPDPVSGDFSGPIKCGQLIENGEIVSSLKEITLTGNMFELFERISALSKERKLISYADTSWLLPSIRVDGMKYIS